MTATALPTRDRATGRFAPRQTIPCCPACLWMLAEDLAGRLYCPHTACEHYRQPVDLVPGVDPGVLTPTDLEPQT